VTGLVQKREESLAIPCNANYAAHLPLILTGKFLRFTLDLRHGPKTAGSGENPFVPIRGKHTFKKFLHRPSKSLFFIRESKIEVIEIFSWVHLIPHIDGPLHPPCPVALRRTCSIYDQPCPLDPRTPSLGTRTDWSWTEQCSLMPNDPSLRIELE
jgi:hypothetical protein